MGTDGTLYVSTGAGSSQYANSVVALDGRSLTVKDSIRHDSAFTGTPLVFTEGNRTYVAVTSGQRLYLLDAASLGGADHRTPLFATQDASNVSFSNDGIATWRDAAPIRRALNSQANAVSPVWRLMNSRMIERG